MGDGIDFAFLLSWERYLRGEITYEEVQRTVPPAALEEIATKYDRAPVAPPPPGDDDDGPDDDDSKAGFLAGAERRRLREKSPAPTPAASATPEEVALLRELERKVARWFDDDNYDARTFSEDCYAVREKLSALRAPGGGK